MKKENLIDENLQVRFAFQDTSISIIDEGHEDEKMHF
jgi:hypothetical protein